VRKGDTLYAIAFGYGLDFRDVADWNGIPRPYTIFPGQELQLAPPRGKDTVTPKSGAQTRAVTTPGSATTRDISKSSTTAANSVPAKTTAAKPAAGSTGGKKTGGASVPVRMSTSAEPASWQWPTNGRVMRGYVAGNPARNGLDIAGKEGQAVWATAAGQVVYSGNGLIGYGELIIIKHSDKLLSAYGHNKVRLVNEGDQVAAGQRIAQMGRNPGNEQILHFEIRVQGKPVNPLTYLPKK
jgi:lipoprotein NlpD